MSLSDLAARGAPPRRTCAACWLESQLAGEDRDALRAALANPGVTSAEVATELAELGYDVPVFTLARHRLGRCARGDRLLP